jgi:hypothetical protein
MATFIFAMRFLIKYFSPANSQQFKSSNSGQNADKLSQYKN